MWYNIGMTAHGIGDGIKRVGKRVSGFVVDTFTSPVGGTDAPLQRKEKKKKKTDMAPGEMLTLARENHQPKDKRELVKMLKSLPEEVLSEGEKRSIAALMSFNTKVVKAVMTDKEDSLLVRADDYLGPLMLDKLHKTGQIHFLVKSGAKIVGSLHISDLLSLKIKESDQVASLLDKNLVYVRDDYSLEMALAAFLRTGALMAVVINREGQVLGSLMLEDLVIYLIGYEVEDDFADDNNRDAVKER